MFKAYIRAFFMSAGVLKMFGFLVGKKILSLALSIGR
jgi:hypothetical protein